MVESSEKKPIQRVLIVLFGLAFLGGSAFGMVGLFTSANQPREITVTGSATLLDELQAQVQGYERVLEREPDNSIALQGLVQAKLQMDDLQGAIAPMEKLVEMHPEATEYKMLLDEIKNQVGQTSAP